MGEQNPDHDLLIFDSDMLTGESIRESEEYFASIGYSQMHAYLALGLPHNGMKPLLEPVSTLLPKGYRLEDLTR